MITVATHVHPDWDAIGAAWMVGQWWQQPVNVVFINAGEHGHGIADYTVDTGHGAFDHHQIADNRTSATELVYLHALELGSDLEHLAPLVAMITAADLGKDEHGAKESRALGIHAMLSTMHARGTSDHDLCRWGFGFLDLLAERLRRDFEARRDMEQWIADRFHNSAESISVAVLRPNAPRGLTQILYENGYDVVFFEGTYQAPGGATRYTRGMSRKDGAAFFSGLPFHCGQVIDNFLRYTSVATIGKDEARAEVERWYRHPSGFFAGISEKGGGTDQPLAISLAQVARSVFLY